ncbi:regulator of chromosome condensation 1/beta-lactamase-inhibitor protein II [Powellomyces hirtus]|nr:regulator of chromosome condensation 1/beta-lactamase-inhibitor protein II [Powellomyces hirtus]
MPKKQSILAFGFDAFGQCSGASSASNKSHLATDSVVSLTPVAQDTTFLALAATLSCSFALSSDQQIHIWGCTELFTGVSSGPSYVRVWLPEVDYGAIRKIVPARSTLDAHHQDAIFALVNNELRLLTFAPSKKQVEGHDQKRRRFEDRPVFEGLDTTTATSCNDITTTSLPFACVDVAVTSTHGAALTTSGDIMTWILGLAVLTRIHDPLDGGPRFHSLASGRLHFMSLTSRNVVYTWGSSGLQGQMGHGTSETHVKPNPEVIEALQGLKATHVAGGGWHSAVATADGDIYTFGSPLKGQLGLAASDPGSVATSDDTSEAPINHAIPSPVDFEFGSLHLKVACGSQHTIVSNGTVLYGCGWTKYNQLGLGTQISEIHEFRPIALPDMDSKVNIADICCGDWHTLVLVEWDE